MRDLTPSEQAIVALTAGKSAQAVALEVGLPKADVASIGRSHAGWPTDLRAIKSAASAVLASRHEVPAETAPEPEVPAAPAAVVTDPDILKEAPMAEPQPEPSAAIAALSIDEQTIGMLTAGITGPVRDASGLDTRGCGIPVPEAAAPSFLNPVEYIPSCSSQRCDTCQSPKGTCCKHCPGWGEVGHPESPADTDALAVLGLLKHHPYSRATLRMPLGRLIDADGRETVLGHAVVEVELHRDGVLAALAGDDIGVSPVTTCVTAEHTPEGAAAIRALAAQLGPVA